MEDLRERLLDFVDWVIDRHYDLKDFLSEHPSVKRWLIEGVCCVAAGILVGVITFNVLNHEKKSLAVTEENAAAPVAEETTGEEDIAAGSAVEGTTDDYSDVVIEVVDPGDYVGDLANWSNEQIAAAISERANYLEGNKYWNAVQSYWESKGISGDARYCKYLADTANTVYSADDFQGLAPEVIHIIKNEMYARHGYSFKNPDLYNYFMGQIWYSPSVMPADFSEKTFTETEVKNLDLLNSLDTM